MFKNFKASVNKKILISSIIGLILGGNNLYAYTSSINKSQVNHSKGNKYFEYDEAKGWWWYKEEIKDKNGKKKIIKTKITPQQKIQMEQQNQLLKLLAKQNQLLEKQNKILKKIQTRLDYAFPDLTPKYGINSKGEKCIANNSSDCFVFPLQPEAQHIPVLARWLKNPSPKNSTEWLKWQAKYFNHLDKIGYGLRFAFLNGGKKAYPTDASITYFDQPTNMIYNIAREHREKQILAKLKNKIGLMVFLGKNIAFEMHNKAYKSLWQIAQKTSFWNKNINLVVVLPNKKAEKIIKDIVYKDPHYKSDIVVKRMWDKLFKEHRVIVNSNMFKKFNIYVTPSVVLTYKKKDKVYWSIIETGTLSPISIRKDMIHYLIYEGVIRPADLQMGDALGSIQKGIKPKFKIKNDFEYKNDVNKIDLDKKGDDNE